LENGFSDGALARWRTIHELTIIGLLIEDGDEALAERYIDHNAVEVKRQADDYEQTQVPLGFPAIPLRERRVIEREFQTTVRRHGAGFGSPYGWASQALRKKKPTFRDLQEAAGRAHKNSSYKLASFNVHASSRSLFFNLGAFGDPDALLAGRSNAGLAEPGEFTAQSLLLMTGLLANSPRNLDRTVMLACLVRIRDAAETALHRARRRLDREKKPRRQQASAKPKRSSKARA
jgi:hypothetical protein